MPETHDPLPQADGDSRGVEIADEIDYAYPADEIDYVHDDAYQYGDDAEEVDTKEHP